MISAATATTRIKTPNIDALAKNGVRFTHGFAAVSSCSPSRASLYTGLHTHTSGQYGLAHAEHNFATFDNVKSLPRAAQRRRLSHRHHRQDPRPAAGGLPLRRRGHRRHRRQPRREGHGGEGEAVLRRRRRQAVLPRHGLLRPAPLRPRLRQRSPYPGVTETTLRSQGRARALFPARSAGGSRRTWPTITNPSAGSTSASAWSCDALQGREKSRQHAGHLPERQRHPLPRRQDDAVRSRACICR